MSDEIEAPLKCLNCGGQTMVNMTCAQCGASHYHLEFHATLPPMTTGLTLHKPGPNEALRLGDGQRSITADLLEEKVLQFELRANRRQNERGNPEVCQILRQKLDDSSQWIIRDPVGEGCREEGVDSILVNPSGGKDLKLQITRVYQSPDFWRLITQIRPTVRSATLNQYVDEVKSAIEKKALRTAQRSEIVLVLDAIETAHAFLNVIDSFRARNTNWVRELGFEAVWIVGPTADLTQRLDIP